MYVCTPLVRWLSQRLFAAKAALFDNNNCTEPHFIVSVFLRAYTLLTTVTSYIHTYIRTYIIHISIYTLFSHLPNFFPLLTSRASTFHHCAVIRKKKCVISNKYLNSWKYVCKKRRKSFQKLCGLEQLLPATFEYYSNGVSSHSLYG